MPLTEERLAQLAVARQKALEKKRQMREAAEREKKEKEQKAATATEAKKKKAADPSLSESSGSSSSSAPKKKTSAKKKNTVGVMSKGELAAQVARDELRRRIDQENFTTAFHSLFPTYRPMHY